MNSRPKRKRTPKKPSTRPCQGVTPAGDPCPSVITAAYGKYCDPCRAKARRKPVLYPWTPELDAILRECWATHHRHKAVVAAMKRTGYPRHIVKSRVVRLGITVPRKKEPPWSKAELDLLDANAWKDPAVIAKIFRKHGFSRSVTAIEVKRKRLRLLEHLEGYSASDLGELLGVDPSIVARWIRRKLLNARWARDKWYITRPAIRTFILKYPESFSYGNVDRVWFVALLAGDEAFAAAPLAGGDRVRREEDSDTED